MSLARQEDGWRGVLRGYASQIHPVFMLPPVGASLAGGTLPFAPSASATASGALSALDPGVGALHTGAIVGAVYTAHVKDGYVDFHQRGEDDEHPLTVRGCRLGLVLATALVLGCLIGLWLESGVLVVGLTAPTWALGYFHAPQLDTTPLGATLGYPVGIALAVLGGGAAQTGGVGGLALGLASVMLVTLTGVKIVDDTQDLAYDRSIEKRTLAVVFGYSRARRTADALFLVAGVLVLWLTVDGPFPVLAPIAPLVFAGVVLLARRESPARATALLIRGTYLLLVLLLGAIWLTPLVRIPLPDVGVFGPYTYLATEIAFGTIALALLLRTGRDTTWRCARTIALLYPLAYTWDWYSLEVGIFAIQLRTGIDFAGIPLEEHLFMIVVPALVIGLHETLERTSSHYEHE